MNKFLPRLQATAIQNDSTTNLIRAIAATALTILFLVFGFFLYNFTLPFLENKPVLLVCLFMAYVPFQIIVMFFSFYFVDKIEMLYRKW